MPRSTAAPLACGLLASIAGSIAGCGSFGGAHPSTIMPPPQPDRPAPEASVVTPMLDLMSALPAGDPAQQAEMFQAAKDRAATAATVSNRLGYALALATPGHAGSDPVAAQRQLSALLANPETMLPVERSLATVELHEVEQRLVMLEEDKQLREDAPREGKDKLAALNRRLSAESDENGRLRKALDEAQAKLDAVTHIERSINDRGTAATTHIP